MDMTINQSDVVAEVMAAFEDYEEALSSNDVATMADAFWSSELAVRYGIAECQYGAEAIDAWRRTAKGVPPGRLLGPTAIVTFGRNMACVNTEFRYPGGDRIGRQSQTWVRLDEGWRVVSAHVSLIDA